MIAISAIRACVRYSGIPAEIGYNFGLIPLMTTDNLLYIEDSRDISLLGGLFTEITMVEDWSRFVFDPICCSLMRCLLMLAMRTLPDCAMKKGKQNFNAKMPGAGRVTSLGTVMTKWIC
jgi:hypothetical protein